MYSYALFSPLVLLTQLFRKRKKCEIRLQVFCKDKELWHFLMPSRLQLRQLFPLLGIYAVF